MDEEKKPVLFIVDDVDVEREYLKAIFQIAVYDVFAFPSASALFTALESTKPDLILLDIMMPEIDGFEATERLKADERYKDIPVLIITADNDIKSIQKGFSLKAAGYIRKEAEPNVMLNYVRGQIEQLQLKKELKELRATITEYHGKEHVK
jgi:CheY-like chemotaxis protein